MYKRMKEMELYQLWSGQELDDPDLNTELAGIAGDMEADKRTAFIVY